MIRTLLLMSFHFIAIMTSAAQPLPDTAGLSHSSIAVLSDKAIGKLQAKYNSLGANIDRQSLQLLTGMQKQEGKIQQQLQSRDSSVAGKVFNSGVQAKYAALKASLLTPAQGAAAPLHEYLPGVDSLQVALKYFQQAGLPADKLQRVQALSQQLQQLQGKFQQAHEIQDFTAQREQQLQTQLSQYSMGKQLLGMNKTVYYYQQQLSQYKSMLNDKQKMEQTILSAVSQLPSFKSFIQKNGMLAQLFPSPANFGTTQAIAGLQTNAQVGASIAQRIGNPVNSSGAAAATGQGAGAADPASGAAGTAGPSGNLDPQQFIDQQTQAAQSALDKLKSRLNGTAGNTNMTTPAFTPNTQKTKTFLQRLEYGFNIQNTPGNSFLPVTTAFALTVGYKISDKATVGVGASYNIGLGSGLDHIKLSSQGIGLRSYLDVKAKGSFWITGGFEYNYLQQFAGLSDIKNLDLWQKSALLGLTKKCNIGKRSANLQLLYDFLAASQVPQASAFKFRIGYSF